MYYSLSFYPIQIKKRREREKEKKKKKSNLWQENKEGWGGAPVDSVSEAKRWPKKAAKEGIAGSPVAQVARFCKWSSFNMDLELIEARPLVCFLPVASSLNEIGLLWNPDGGFGAAFLFPPAPLLPMFRLVLCSLTSLSISLRNFVKHLVDWLFDLASLCDYRDLLL